MNKYSSIFFGMLTLPAAEVCGAARVELYSAPLNPSHGECIAIARENAVAQKRILLKHEECLKGAPSDKGAYQKSDPCSKLACLDIHHQMVWVGEQIGDINKECNARIPKVPQQIKVPESPFDMDPAAPGSSAQDIEKRKELLLRVDELYSNGQTAYEMARNRDRPWALAEMAWGAGADKVRRELADRVSGGATRNNLDWDVYDLIFNKANTQLGAAAANPVARLVNEAMMTKLYAMHAQVYGQFQGALQNMDTIASALPQAAGASRFERVYDRPLSSSGMGRKNASRTATDPSSDCLIFKDVQKSSTLLSANSDAWMALNNRCNK